MSTQLLPITHPDIQRRLALGHAAGIRAAFLTQQAEFLTGAEREARLEAAELQIETARHHFTHAHRHADYSEPEVTLSNETWRAYEAEREAAKAKPVVHPGKGAHWAAKRAAQAA